MVIKPDIEAIKQTQWTHQKTKPSRNREGCVWSHFIRINWLIMKTEKRPGKIQHMKSKMCIRLNTWYAWFENCKRKVIATYEKLQQIKNYNGFDLVALWWLVFNFSPFRYDVLVKQKINLRHCSIFGGHFGICRSTCSTLRSNFASHSSSQLTLCSASVRDSVAYSIASNTVTHVAHTTSSRAAMIEGGMYFFTNMYHLNYILQIWYHFDQTLIFLMLKFWFCCGNTSNSLSRHGSMFINENLDPLMVIATQRLGEKLRILRPCPSLNWASWISTYCYIFASLHGRLSFLSWKRIVIVLFDRMEAPRCRTFFEIHLTIGKDSRTPFAKIQIDCHVGTIQEHMTCSLHSTILCTV